ncbi:ankyrin [Melanomma pulvis-pyrius CBS 109.77]|uniref:Ankyrin n=1 Tax=Melanomma pulvis-pyrius CBS 109.77 TaxID=1314802 RepID=A0A6A6XNP6_9PLEO|nr:ankyrin [Melanomma pulvis-pyrius CBS 109.77]
MSAQTQTSPPNGAAATTTTNSVEPPPNSTPTAPSHLPPEALDLAAKLFDYARAGSTSHLQPYLAAGIPPNLTNSAGDTLLMLASYHGHAGTAKALLDAGADPNVLNGRGQSPIAGAVFKGYDEVVRVLWEGRADTGAGHPNAVDCAVMFKREECLALFGAGDEGDTAAGNGL